MLDVVVGTTGPGIIHLIFAQKSYLTVPVVLFGVAD